MLLERGDVVFIDKRMIDFRNGILPNKLFRRHLRSEIARTRTHVAMGQFEPCARKCVGKFIGMLVETPRNLFVDRVVA